MIFVLDACSVINLIHINEGELLFNKFLKLNPKISNVVFDEIRKNVFGIANSENDTETIEIKLMYLRSNIVQFSHIISTSDTIYNKIKELSGYEKDNGEFHSVVLSLYLSRMDETKVIFITDDYPAKDFFNDFFNFNKIGYIEDSIDIILFLYAVNNDITYNQINNLLSNLYSQYSLYAKLLHDKLSKLMSNLPAAWVKDIYIKYTISKCINCINTFNFNELGLIYTEIKNKKKYSKVINILKEYKAIFEIGNKKETNFLSKIIETRKQLKFKNLYKLI